MKKFCVSLLLLSIFLSSCVQKNGTAINNNNGNTIKIGLFADLTGQTSAFGQSSKNGAQLAVDEINATGGVVGKKLEIVIEDDQGRPEQAKTVVSKLINQDKVQVILGEAASTNSLAAAPVAQEAKIPMVTHASTNEQVTQVGNYIFRICFIDSFQGSVMAKFAANNLKAKTAAIIGDVNSTYSKGLTEVFEKEFTNLGGKIVSKQSYTQNDPDFKGQLTTVRALNPDVIYIPGYYGQVGIIAKQARELGMTMPLLGGDGWDAPEIWKLGGEGLKNTFISNHYAADNPAPEVQNFVKSYKEKYGVQPDSMAVLAYDAVKLLADAVKRAGGANSEKLRDAIAQTKDFAAVTGKISINEKRDAVKLAVVLELDPSKSAYLYKETIYPNQ
ncbi:MAG: ABC transporter substrate-binding protein [Pyrinomonadaceae bacterium]|nr:ABC transporter substrate-binding protein [Pyrinomonadaceae bacterium]